MTRTLTCAIVWLGIFAAFFPATGKGDLVFLTRNSEVARNGDAIPDSNDFFDNSGFGSPSIRGGRLVFTGRGNQGTRGIYWSRDLDPLDKLIDNSDPEPGGSAPLTGFNSLSLQKGVQGFESDPGRTVFQANYGGQGNVTYAAFVIDQLGYRTIEQTKTGATLQTSAGTAQVFRPFSTWSNQDNIAVTIEFDTANQTITQGVYGLIDDTARLVADTGMSLPGTSETFSGFSNAEFEGRAKIVEDTIVFYGEGSEGTRGLFAKTGDGEVKRLVDTTMNMPNGGNVQFSGFDGFTIDGDTVAFTGTGSGRSGVYTVSLSDPSSIDVVVDNDSEINGRLDGWNIGFQTVSTSDGKYLIQGQQTRVGQTPRQQLFTNIRDATGQFEIVPATLDGANRNFSITEQSLEGDVFGFQVNHVVTGRSIHRYAVGTIGEGAERFTPTLSPGGGNEAATKLVLITHGWLGSDTSGDDTKAWLDEMESRVLERLPNDGSWEVRVLDWRPAANTGPLDWLDGHLDAYDQAQTQGHALATELVQNNYEHIHFIGNSAAAGVFNAAIAEIRRDGSGEEGPYIHATFLDAFIPIGDLGKLGSGANWAEHYVNRDEVSFTNNRTAPNAFTIDVSALGPGGLAGHSFPREIYSESIEGDSNGLLEGYGFDLSREVNPDWFLNPALYQHGWTDELGDGKGPFEKNFDLREVIHNLAMDDALSGRSQEGLINYDEDVITLTTGPSVWLVTGFDFETSINFLEFEFAFLNGAEGFLSVYFDEELIGTLDERWVTDGQIRYSFSEQDSGWHTIGLRLDPYTEDSSSLSIWNVNAGLTTAVPEPSHALFLSIIFGIGTYVRHRFGRTRRGA